MDETVEPNSDKSVILQLLQIRTKAPALFWTIVFIVSAEVFVVGIAPLIVPNHIYLRLYLNSKSEANIAQFSRGEDRFMVYDEIVGWRNRPNTSLDLWSIDEHGSRSVRRVGLDKEKPVRVLFLGNSLTNGGAQLNIEATISALVEDSLTEAINFGTMLYSLDQMYLDYSHRLKQFESDYVVIGVQSDPGDGLVNQFVPFWKRSEANLPYLKPRFKMNGDDLELISMPGLDVFSNCLEDARLLDELAEEDEYYAEFESYKRFGHLPLSGAIWKLTRGVTNLSNQLTKEYKHKELVVGILSKLREETDANGAKLIVLMFPDQEKVFPGIFSRLFPDQYGNLVTSLRDAKFEIVDARDAISDSELAAWQVYYSDQRHFLPRGNETIAHALREKISELGEWANIPK